MTYKYRNIKVSKRTNKKSFKSSNDFLIDSIGRRFRKQIKSKLVRRVLSFFVHNSSRAWRPVEIYKMQSIDPLNYNSIRTAIRRLVQLGLIVRVRRGVYKLVDKRKALMLLNSQIDSRQRLVPKVDRGFESIHTFNDKSNTVREWFGQFLDLESAIFEHAEVRFRVKRTIADKIRGNFAVNVRDKAKQVVVRGDSFTLVVSKYGSCRLFLNNPYVWLTEFVRFLREKNLDENEVKYVLKMVLNSLSDSQVAVEIPIVRDSLRMFRNFTVETKVGGKTLIATSIYSSHFPLELEVKGDFNAALGFISALSGVQHFSILEFIQAQQLQEINAKFNVLAEVFGKLADKMKDLAQTKVTLSYALSKQKEKEGDLSYVS